MHKYPRRHDIIPHKFMVEVYISKVELKLPQQCRIAVIFKRGKYKKETTSAPPLEKGVAVFDEKLSAPATFYFDKSKNAFLLKEATIALNIITAKTQKLAGVTKFDLAPFLNSNTTEADVALKIEKSSDKNAKFHFKLKMLQQSELDPCTSFKDEGESTLYFMNENTMHFDDFADKHPILGEINFTNNLDHGDGQLSPQAEKIDRFFERMDLTSSRLESSPRSSVLENRINNERVSQNRFDQQSMTRTREKRPANQSNKDRIFKNAFDTKKENEPWLSNIKSAESFLQENFENTKSLISHLEDLGQIKMVSSQILEKPPNKKPLQVLRDDKGIQNVPKRMEITTQTDVDLVDMHELDKIVNLFEESQQRIFDLEAQAVVYQQTIKDLHFEIEENNENLLLMNKNYEDLKQTYTSLCTDFEHLQKESTKDRKSEKRADFDLQIYKEKVFNLEKELEELKLRKESVSKRSRTLDYQEIKDIQEYYASKRSSNAGDFDLPQIEEYKTTIYKLKQDLKDAHRKIGEVENTKNKEIEDNKAAIEELTNENNNLREELEEKETQLQNLEIYIEDLEDDMQFMKVQEVTSQIQSLDLSEPNVDKFNREVKEIEQESPTKVRKTLQELKTENIQLKRELDQVKTILSLNRIDHHEDASPNSPTPRANKKVGEEEDFTAKINHLEHEKGHLKSELKKAKMGWATADIEKYNLMGTVKEHQEKIKSKEQRIEFLEVELFRLKTQIAELINTIMEFGGTSLLDKIEDIVTVNK